MENLYRLNEWSGELPNPMYFPKQGIIIAVKDRPYIFGDGFILDLSVREADKEILKGKAVRVIPFPNLTPIISDAEWSKTLLSEPKYIYDITYPTYILFTPDDEVIGIQVKYYQYFRNHYPKCLFYSKGGPEGIITVKVDGKLVGACMPMFLEEKSIKRIKEEKE